MRILQFDPSPFSEIEEKCNTSSFGCLINEIRTFPYKETDNIAITIITIFVTVSLGNRY